MNSTPDSFPWVREALFLEDGGRPVTVTVGTELYLLFPYLSSINTGIVLLLHLHTVLSVKECCYCVQNFSFTTSAIFFHKFPTILYWHVDYFLLLLDCTVKLYFHIFDTYYCPSPVTSLYLTSETICARQNTTCLLKLAVRIVSTMKQNKQISDKWLFCSEMLLKSGRHTLMVCLGYYIGKNLTFKNAGPQSFKSSLSVLIRKVCVFSRLPVCRCSFVGLLLREQ